MSVQIVYVEPAYIYDQTCFDLDWSDWQANAMWWEVIQRLLPPERRTSLN